MLRPGFASLLALLVVIAGCKSTPPGKVEQNVMTWSKHSIFVRNRSEHNPLQPTEANIASGKEAFSHYCVACHGLDGQNTGVPFADNISPPIPPLTSQEVQTYTDG